VQLTRDPSLADILLDLSNVCSREVLGGDGVALERMTTAVAVFEEWSGIASAQVFAVADNSLFGRLASREDRRTLRAYVDDGLVEALPGADERLLDLVALTGGLLMTWDRFEGHRDVYPWLQGDTEHFLLVRSDNAGDLRLGLRDMGVVSTRRVSERAEIDTLKAAHLLDSNGRPDDATLSKWWRCPDNRCSLFSLDRSKGQPIPLRDRGGLVCSLHRLPLLDAGIRPRQMQLKIIVGERVVERVVLEDDGPALVIGRGGVAGVNLSPYMDDTNQDLISRRHIAVRMQRGELHVCDQGSTNGTQIISDGAIMAVPHTDYPVPVTHQVLLADVVTIQISGRRYPSISPRQASSGPDSGGVTRLS
jgi:hypothetical protein